MKLIRHKEAILLIALLFPEHISFVNGAEIITDEGRLLEFLQPLREQQAALVEGKAEPKNPLTPEDRKVVEELSLEKLRREPPDLNDGEGGFFVDRVGFRLVWQGMRKQKVLEYWGEPTAIVRPRYDELFDLLMPEMWYWTGQYPAFVCIDEQGRVCTDPRSRIDWLARRQLLQERVFTPLRRALGKPLD